MEADLKNTAMCDQRQCELESGLPPPPCSAQSITPRTHTTTTPHTPKQARGGAPDVLQRGEAVTLGVVPAIPGAKPLPHHHHRHLNSSSSSSSMTTAYAGAGLRWAFQALHVRNAVVGVMEEMLATIEVRL